MKQNKTKAKLECRDIPAALDLQITASESGICNPR